MDKSKKGSIAIPALLALTAGTIIYTIFGKKQPPPGAIPTHLTLAVANTNINAGATDTASLTLTDQNGSALPNYPVTLMANGSTISTSTTGNNGTANINFQIASPGTYTIQAKA